MAISYRTRKILLLLLALQKIRRKNRKITWKKPIVQKKEDTNGTGQDTFFNLLSEMRLTDMLSFLEFFRVTPKQFDHLLSLVGSEIFPRNNNNQEAISARDRLALTLRYLASGDSMKIVSGIFKVSQPTMSKVVFTVCHALWDALAPIHIPAPNASSWEEVANQMNSLFQFPNCVGAVGGKFFKQIQQFWNVTFLAVCDANLKFLFVDINSYVKKKTGITFESTALSEAIEEGKLDLPPPVRLSGAEEDLPYVFAASERFPLKTNIMRPYPDDSDDPDEAVFNYRVSRCSNLIDNAFGVMASRFRILSKPIYTKEPSVLAIAMATACLHNYLLSDDDASQYYCPVWYRDFEDADGTLHEGAWRSEEEFTGIVDVSFTGSNTFLSKDAHVRDALNTYFCEAGETGKS